MAEIHLDLSRKLAKARKQLERAQVQVAELEMQVYGKTNISMVVNEPNLSTDLENRVIERTAELLAAKERAEAILNNSMESMVLLSSDLHIRQTNPAFDQLFACEFSQSFNQPLSYLCEPSVYEHLLKMLEVKKNNSVHQNIQFQAVRRDGTGFDAELSISHIENDGFVCSIRDITERKAQELQLRYQASLQENVSDAVIVTDMELRIQSWNRAAERIYGWRAEEVVHLKTGSILSTEFPTPDGLEIAQKKLQGQGWWQQKVTQRHKDGTLRYILGSVTLIKDESGVPFAIIAVNRDITEQKQAESVLRESEARYRLLAENISDMIIKFDPDGTLTFVTPSSYALLGYLPEELVGRGASDIVHPDDFLRATARVMQAIDSSHSNFLTTQRVRHKAGRYIWFEVTSSIVRDPDTGNLIGFVSIFRDITERKKIEAELREAEHRYRALFEQSHDAIFLFDMQGNQLEINRRASEMLGYSVEELRTLSCRDLSVEVPKTESMIQYLLAGETIPMYERILSKKDGNKIHVEINVEIVRDFDGNALHVQMVARDITERKRAEESLRDSEERFRHAIIDAPFPIMIHAEDGEILHISRTWTEITGYSHDDIPTMTDWTDKAYGEDRQRVREVIKKVYALVGPQRGGEFRIRTKSGEERIWDFISAPLALMPDGRRTVSSMAMDITERKQAESMLQVKMQEELQFQTYLKALHEITIDLTEIEDLDEFYKLVIEFGRTRLDFERLALFRYNEKDRTALGTFGTDTHGAIADERTIEFTPDPKAMMMRALRSSERFYFEDNLILYNNMVPVGTGWNAAAVLWNGTRSLGWLVADNLISRRPASKLQLDIMGLYALTVGTLLAKKEAKEALKNSEALYRMLAENISDLVSRIDSVGNYEYVSPSSQIMLGYTPEELVNTSVFALIHPDDRAHLITRQNLASEPDVTMSPSFYRMQHKSGHFIWVETRGQTLRSQDKSKVIGFVTVSRDLTERKRSEEALRHSQQMLQNVIENIPVDLFWKDRNSIYQGCNTSHARKLGLSSPDEFTGKSDIDFFPELAPLWMVEDQEVMATKKSILNVENMITDAYGTTRWQRSSKVALTDAIGEAHGVLVTIEDITERKRIVAELDQQRSFLRNVIDVSPSMIFVKDYDGRFVLANPMVAQLYNTTVDALIGKTDADFNPSIQEVENFLEGDRRVIISGNPLYLEEPVTNFAGETRWFQTTKVPIVSSDGKNAHVLGISTDITERIRSEAALKESEAKYRSLIETMRGGLVIFDLDNKITFINDRFCELIGYSREEVIGTRAIDYVDTTNIPILVSHVTRRKNLESSSYELLFRHKDGRPVNLLVSGSPLLDRSGKFNGSFAVATDITLQKQAEVALRQALAKETELGELKSRFVSMASHEFRTPLATILALTETLSAYRSKLNEDQIDERFDKIKEQVSYLKDIMEDVLLLARMQSRRVEFNPVNLNLDDLCLSVLDEFQSKAEFEHSISFSGTIEPIQVFLDKKLMRQIISNLVSNAAKYSPPSTSIKVAIEYVEDSLTLIVSDEGLGIPEIDLPHLFEPFHRANNVGTISGTGLGLVIVKEAVDLHHGTIAVDSQLDIGTTFKICIPLPIKDTSENI